jgi:ATP-dependent Clp protease adaptor protein ClpS
MRIEPALSFATPHSAAADVAELIPLKQADDADGDLYHVVLLRDEQHTPEYVAEMLPRLFFTPEQEAKWLADEVFAFGRATVLTCEWSTAEFAKRQIESYGPDPRVEGSEGSMRASIEWAGGHMGVAGIG